MPKYKDEYGREYEDISEFLMEKIDGDEHGLEDIEIAKETANNCKKVISNLLSILVDNSIIKTDVDTIDKLLKGVW